MKGVITAAGRGTRMWPLTKVVDKVLLPIYDRPVLFWAIDALVREGIDEVIIVGSSRNAEAIKQLVGDGKEWGLKRVEVLVKDHDQGMPFSLLQAEEFADGDSFMVVPGDNLFLEDFSEDIAGFSSGAMVTIRQEPDLHRFGVAKYKGNKLVDIVEKPKNPPSKWGVIAPYWFDNRAFDYIRELKHSARGELEIVDLLKRYLAQGELKLVKKNSYWKDIGVYDALLEASNEIKKIRDKEGKK